MSDFDINLQPPGNHTATSVAPSSTAFHSQLDYLHHTPPATASPHAAGHYVPPSFDMAAVAGALPHPVAALPHQQHPVMNIRPQQYPRPDVPAVLSPASVYQMQQQASHYPTAARNPPLDPTAMARVQQQQSYLHMQYAAAMQQQQQQAAAAPMAARAPMPYPAQMPPQPMNAYGYGMNALQVPMVDPRLAPQATIGLPQMMPRDMSQYPRSASEPAPVPNYPRGPPRKPKQSGHALWVGNLPPGATVTDLKDHFSRDATRDIESLFLISKSNCAFVNYRSEAACVAAMNRFHDSRFHGVRLVCRLRRGAALSTSPAASAADVSETPSADPTAAPSPAPEPAEEEFSSPTIVGSSPSPAKPSSSAGIDNPIPNERPSKTPEKYFIVKSLTAQDLEASVRNGIWATQSHNEDVLNKAYADADAVYLVFSANKSGEYFGYARMASHISGDPVSLTSNTPAATTTTSPHPPDDPARSPGAPQSIPTPATHTAPRGRIIDDSARGTIFWEAEPPERDSSGASSPTPGSADPEPPAQQNWGRQFSIEWVSTARLPFYRTRGLRNPWNANREVKIARDGTELEPGVGRRLVQMFHRPSPGAAVGAGAAVPVPMPGMGVPMGYQ